MTAAEFNFAKELLFLTKAVRDLNALLQVEREQRLAPSS